MGDGGWKQRKGDFPRLGAGNADDGDAADAGRSGDGGDGVGGWGHGVGKMGSVSLANFDL